MAKIINAGILGNEYEKIVVTEDNDGIDSKKANKKRIVVKKSAPKTVRTKKDDKEKTGTRRDVTAENRAVNKTEKPAGNNAVFESKNIIPVRINRNLLSNLRETVETLRKIGRENAAEQLETIYARGTRKKFSAAVVGEFSKGKSSFINNLLEKDILPVGDLPTTALLTRIRYANNEQMVHFKGNGKKKEFPLSEDSWDGLVAENFSDEDPTGFVVAGVRSRWLGENNIEIIDTPGAGDLEDKRAKPIGDALVGCDCAIITIAATAPLSLTEKLFIEQRLITKKTPFLMLIVTKLDMINEGERESVIDYIKEKLGHWEMDIPVFIPGIVEMGSDKYGDIMGYDKIKDQIKSWINDPERVELTEMWIRAQAADVLEREIMFYTNQKDILDADDKKCEEMIADKKRYIDNSDVVWGDLRMKLAERCNGCIDAFNKKVLELQVPVIEKLQYEVSRSNDVQRWWNEDYPYRLKVEIANMSVALDNHISRIMADDIKWFNASLEKQFKVHIDAEREVVIDRSVADNIAYNKGNQNIQIDNLDKKKRESKIGIAGATIALAFGLATVIGSGTGLPITMLASTGFSTGAGLISDSVFKKKIQEQRDTVKKTLASAVSLAIEDAICGSDLKIKKYYDEIIKQTEKKEVSWKEMHKEAVEAGLASKNKAQHENIEEKIGLLVELGNKIIAVK